MRHLGSIATALGTLFLLHAETISNTADAAASGLEQTLASKPRTSAENPKPNAPPSTDNRNPKAPGKPPAAAGDPVPAQPDSQAAATPKPRLFDAQLDETEEFVATIDVTHGKEPLGQIVVRLHHKYAPSAVRNFVKLAESGFYNGTRIHRIGPESFIQGGDPLSRDADPSNDGTGGPGYDLSPQPNEKPAIRGAFCAARVGQRDSGSQFFLCLKDHPEWDRAYTVFGNVITGMEIADRIGSSPHKHDHPTDDFWIQVKVEKRKRQLKLY